MGLIKKFLDRDADLRARVAQLESEVQECRAVNLRLAELCDVVVELLVPIAERDEAKVDEVVARYRQDIESIAG